VGHFQAVRRCLNNLTGAVVHLQAKGKKSILIIISISKCVFESCSLTPPSIPKNGFFFTEHYPWLLGHVRGKLNCRMDAEDTAAETFYQLLASRIDTDSLARPRAYLSTIAHRLVFKLYRRRKLEAAYLEHLAALPIDLAPSPEDSVLLLELLTQLDHLLGGLPAPVKKAFLYSQLDGFSYPEIARRMGVSERSVGRYMTQALRHCLLGGLQP